MNKQIEPLTKIILDLEEDLQGGWVESTWEELEKKKAELEEVRVRSELMHKENDRIKWLEEGDCNTKIFHATIKMRQAHNGDWTRVEEIGKAHFKELLKENFVTDKPSITRCNPHTNHKRRE